MSASLLTGARCWPDVHNGVVDGSSLGASRESARHTSGRRTTRRRASAWRALPGGTATRWRVCRRTRPSSTYWSTSRAWCRPPRVAQRSSASAAGPRAAGRVRVSPDFRRHPTLRGGHGVHGVRIRGVHAPWPVGSRARLPACRRCAASWPNGIASCGVTRSPLIALRSLPPREAPGVKPSHSLKRRSRLADAWPPSPLRAESDHWRAWMYTRCNAHRDRARVGERLASAEPKFRSHGVVGQLAFAERIRAMTSRSPLNDAGPLSARPPSPVPGSPPSMRHGENPHRMLGDIVHDAVRRPRDGPLPCLAARGAGVWVGAQCPHHMFDGFEELLTEPCRWASYDATASSSASAAVVVKVTFTSRVTGEYVRTPPPQASAARDSPATP